MRGDADRASVAAALHRLDATSGEHVSPSGADDIGSEAKGDHLATWTYKFPRSDYFEAIANAEFGEDIVGSLESGKKRYADAVHEGFGGGA